GLRHEAAADLFAGVTADGQGPPVELLGEVHLRGQARGREERVHRVGLNDTRVARIVDARAEPRPRRETLLVLPAEADGRPGAVELAEPPEGDASVDEPVEPLVAALGSELQIARRI